MKEQANRLVLKTKHLRKIDPYCSHVPVMNAHLCGVDPVVADDQIPAELRKQLNILTSNPVIEIPVRTEGITAGEAKRCYWNSNVLAQTFGGEAIYGWSIQDLTRREDLFILHGHAVWKTPEGKLVDPTPVLDGTTRLFIPLTNQLVLNGRVTEKINTLFFPTGPRGIHFSLMRAVEATNSSMTLPDEKIFDIYGEHKIKPEPFINKLVEVGAIRGDLIEDIFMDLSYKNKHLKDVFDARVRVVDQSTPIKVIQDSTRGFMCAFKRCFKRGGGNVWEETRGYELGDDQTGRDMTWDYKMYSKPTLTRISTTSGKRITDYPPLQSILDLHQLPKSKKQRRKVEQIAQKNNLAPNEVVMLSNPYLYPHPNLVKKAGGAKIQRINIKTPSVGVSSQLVA